jgi:hypothetical protein
MKKKHNITVFVIVLGLIMVLIGYLFGGFENMVFWLF